MGAQHLCSDCGRNKPEDEFYLRKGRAMAQCRVCWQARVRLRRLTDPKVREYDRARAKTPKRIARAVHNTRRWRNENPQAYRAQNALNNGLRDGKVTRKPCEMCAAVAHVHAHHRDYSKPLDVVWLCARCHHRMHALFPQVEGRNKRAGGSAP